MTSTLNSAAQLIARTLLGHAQALTGGDELLLEYVEELGWTLPQVPETLRDLQSASAGLVESLAKLEALRRQGLETADTNGDVEKAAAELLLDLTLYVSAVRKLPAGLRGQLPSAFITATRIDEKIHERLLNDAIVRQVESEHPDLYLGGRLLGLIEAIDQPADPDHFQPQFVERRFRWDRVTLLAGDPAALMRDVYGWGTPTLESEKLMLALRDLSFTLLSPSFFDYAGRPMISAIAPGADPLSRERGLQLPLFTDSPLEVSVGLFPAPKQQPDELQGLMMTLSGLAAISESLELGPSLSLELKSTIDLATGIALGFWPDRPPKLLGNISASPGEVVKGANATLTVNYAPPDETSRLPLLSFDGVQLDFRSVALEAGIGKSADAAVEAYVQAGLKQLRLQLGGLNQDSFLAKVLPGSVALEFDLAFGWSMTRGLYWQNAVESKLTIPVHTKIGPFTLDNLEISLGSSDGKTQVTFGVSIAAQIGPIFARVDGVGAAITVDTKGGNLGFIDVGFAPAGPRAVGLTIDAKAVTGSGFLSVDRARGQYEGLIQLTINDFLTVTAIGIITTKLPNGERGFSMVIMITAQGFKPIQLGLGFTLAAIGGLLAINRTCNEEFLREGIKNNTLESLLFPKDPIRNAPQIFGTLNQAFPPRIDNYLFGPVVRIGWGTPPLLTMDLALILEIGKRRRLIILGRVSAIMPSEKHDLIRLQMNALGVIDFDQSSISLDAVLFDSRLAGKFPITGSMALRLNWGSAPIFALSIGGFHPAFKPPANFPVLQRLAISFSNTSDFKLWSESYFAITSNTLQFGAKLELFAKAGGFSIEGRVGYDVLIQFDPFMFVAEFYASVQLKRGSFNLFKVKVEGELSGPRPLHVKGKATFEIFWWDFSVRFDRTLIQGEKPPKLAPINVTERLVASLNESQNWTGQLPENVRRLVTIREPQTAQQIVFHPLGTLGVKQNVVPFDLEISRFGNTTPAGDRSFKIKSFTVTGKEVTFNKVKDFFSPSQFLDMTDEEKLSAPSFELLNAGFSAGVTGFLFSTKSDDILEAPIKYETLIIDGQPKTETDKSQTTITPDFFTRHLPLGAAARSGLRRTGNTKYRSRVNKYSLPTKGWTVSSTEDGSKQGTPDFAAGTVSSYAEAFQAVQKLKATNPAKAKKLMVVRTPVEPE